ncbi:MAG: phosphofructokinase [Desulfobacteraceae bacterium]|nr:MAG: phosphofructokinase [Desulfobacteraceae bacterium]
MSSLLSHPQVKEVIAEVNAEMTQRRLYKPGRIAIFDSESTELEEMSKYRFTIDTNARKLLPDLMGTPVQQLIPGSGSDNVRMAGKRKITFDEPRNIGVVFSGGPAPGGHNVICGLYDEAKRINPDSRIYGFLLGPDGLIDGEYIEISKEIVDAHRNMGGFSMLRTGRTKIDSPKKMDQSRQTCLDLKLNALVIIGGDDSNTNAAFLAQNFKSAGIQVIGVPKTIDGDLQVRTDDGELLCAISFGFHTAARTFSQSISNLTADGASDVKYWHVCKVMGRVASHLALESALQTHANLTLIGEELADYVDQDRIERARNKGITDYNAYGITLRHVSRLICDIIVRRAAVGKNYGVLIIPEGLLEFINEIQVFIIKLNKIIADYNLVHDQDFHLSFPSLEAKLDYLKRLARGMTDASNIPIWNSRDDELFNQLPSFFQEGLLVERDLHGNFQFSQVRTEQIIMDMVKEYLGFLKDQGTYKIGIDPAYFASLFKNAGLDADRYGSILFNNYGRGEFLLIKSSIISQKTLKNALVSEGLLSQSEQIPEAVLKIFKKSEPKFKTQTHFYGYDGRSADPTHFDCNYTYNLGMTAFHLIANGATGQLAAIRNLEHHFDQWEPIGIPIASLMHLEERKGKLELVIEKALVDLESNAFKTFKALREHWLAAHSQEDFYRRPGPIRFSGETVEDRPISLLLNSISDKEAQD